MKQLEIWFLKNDLIINKNKTVTMSFHLCCTNHTFCYNIRKSNMSQVTFLDLCVTGN